MTAHIIHTVWISDDGQPMPDWARFCLDRLIDLHGADRVVVHGRSSVPDDMRAACDGKPAHYLSDAIRYAALRDNGGWYVDLDSLAFCPFEGAEYQWLLSGKFAVSEMGNGPQSRMPYAATPLFCERGHEVARYLCERIKSMPEPDEYSSWGPQLITDAVKLHPRDCVVMPSAFWLPAQKANAINDAAVTIKHPQYALAINQDTNGLAPYAMHLWAHGNEALGWDKEPDAFGKKTKTAAIMAFDPRYKHLDRATRSASIGLTAAGYDCHIIELQQNENPWRDLVKIGIPDVAVIWNGRRNGLAEVNKLEAMGVPVFRMENGFFDRKNNWQCDRDGFCHTASYAKARTEARGKYSGHVTPTTARNDGYVLVLGQVSGDTQLDQSEIRNSLDLDKFLARSLGRDLVNRCRFRPHPQELDHYNRRKARGSTYLPTCEASTLDEALDGARFVITINSNSITEACIAGVPVAAMGPSTAINYGAAYAFDNGTFSSAWTDMMRGWVPDQSDVDNYLAVLEENQYGAEDISRAEFWEARI